LTRARALLRFLAWPAPPTVRPCRSRPEPHRQAAREADRGALFCARVLEENAPPPLSKAASVGGAAPPRPCLLLDPQAHTTLRQHKTEPTPAGIRERENPTKKQKMAAYEQQPSPPPPPPRFDDDDGNDDAAISKKASNISGEVLQNLENVILICRHFWFGVGAQNKSGKVVIK